MNIPCTTHKVRILHQFYILVTLQVNGKDLTMELDTRATVSIVSEKTYQNLFSPHAAPQLKTSKAKLKAYAGEILTILGDQCEC